MQHVLMNLFNQFLIQTGSGKVNIVYVVCGTHQRKVMKVYCLFVTCLQFTGVCCAVCFFCCCFCLSSLLMKCFMNELTLDANATNKIQSERNRHWAMIFPSAVMCMAWYLIRLLFFIPLFRRMKLKTTKSPFNASNLLPRLSVSECTRTKNCNK